MKRVFPMMRFFSRGHFTIERMKTAYIHQIKIQLLKTREYPRRTIKNPLFELQITALGSKEEKTNTRPA